MKWGGNMNKLFMLAFANIRKTKGHTISLFFMFFIAALLLNAGLLVSINFGNYFEQITKELNTSNIYYVMPRVSFTEEVRDLLEEDSNVSVFQEEDTIWANAKVKYGNETRISTFLLCNADQERELSRWKFVGKHLEPDEMSIYIPYVYQLEAGYELNDPFEIRLEDITLTFTIKGFTDDIFFSSLDTGLLGVYLPHDTFEYVNKVLDDKYNAVTVYTNLREVNKDLESEIKNLTGLESISNSTDYDNSLLSFDLGLIKLSRTMMASMVSAIFVVFSALLVIVCLVVVRFRIGNSIEDDMTKIGSLKAMGYTGRQIIFSIVLQFLMIAFVGSILGIASSYLITPVLSDAFAGQSGLKWVQGFDSGISSFALFFMLSIVILVAYLSAGRIRRLHPIEALRGGIATHSFRKNHMPLSKAFGSLPLVMALKSLLQNKKQGLMVTVILIGASFAGAFAVIMFYNTTFDTRAFKETPGIEISNAFVVFRPEVDSSGLVEKINNMEHIRKAQFIDETVVTLDDNEIRVYVMEDYTKKETNTVYQGRYPLHNNEIVISGLLANMLDKTVGDIVTVKVGDNQNEFLITGLSQGSNMGGYNASIKYDAMMKLNEEFKQVCLQIYLDKGTDAGALSEELKDLYKDQVLTVIDMDKSFEDGIGMYTSIVSKVGIAILVITIAVVILVLYFVINSSVTRRKRELGIQKAIGFTTLQLMNQISISVLPPIILGVLIGSYLGSTQGNAIMSISQRSMGIMKADYTVTPEWIALFGIGIVVLSYVISMLLTFKIRKISAYSLIKE